MRNQDKLRYAIALCAVAAAIVILLISIIVANWDVAIQPVPPEAYML